jgi:uncharacterized membrane protein YkvA (DUF1232 family)
VILTIQGGAIQALNSRLQRELMSRAEAVPGDRAEQLQAEIGGHLDKVRSALSHNEFLDLGLAKRIASTLNIVLSAYRELSSDHARALVIGAARFFLDADDVWPDLESPVGFDDDAEVLNAVLKDIGREDLLIKR